MLIGALLASTVFLGVAAYKPTEMQGTRTWSVGGIAVSADGSKVWLPDTDGIQQSVDGGVTWKRILEAG